MPDIPIKNSFAKTCLLYFLIFALFIFLVFNGINHLITNKLNTVVPNIENLLVYEEDLLSDDFSQIPIQDFQNCAFAVFDNNYHMIYASDQQIRDHLNGEDIAFISNHYAGSQYAVYEEQDANGNMQYHIFEYTYDESNNIAQAGESCVLDASYNIIEGNLFEERSALTEKEFGLLKGIYANQKNIEKFEYETLTDESRTLIFISTPITEKNYQERVDAIVKLWFWAIPVLLAAIIIAAYFLYRNVKKALDPLDRAIADSLKGQHILYEDSSLPSEFHNLIQNFNQLIHNLKKSEAEKDELNAERQRTIANISHDLKTPLTVIQGYSKALQDNIVPESKKSYYIDTIHSKSIVISDMLASLLEYAKMEHPDYQPEFRKTDLSEFCREYLADKYNEFQMQGFILHTNLPEDKLYCALDLKLMTRLFDNLLNNAIKYNPKGTTISFTLEQIGHSAFLTIADNGIGIPNSVKANLFSPFVTGDASRKSGNGTGLGLVIAKKITELHNGSLSLSSTSKKFSTEFVIHLPLIIH